MFLLLFMSRICGCHQQFHIHKALGMNRLLLTELVQHKRHRHY